MQAIILAAGKSTRFYPFNNYGHKSCVKICGKTIIEHTMLSVKSAGVTDVIIVVSPDSPVKSMLGNGEQLGLSITYVEQPEPLGAGNAVLLCKQFITGDFFLVNASRVDFAKLCKPLLDIKTSDDMAVLLGKKEERLGKYGVLKIENDRVVDLIEKPESGKEPSNFRLIGIYLFGNKFLQVLKDTPTEHYQLEAAIATLARKEGIKLATTDRTVVSLKYAWDLLEVKNYLLENMEGKISENAQVSKDATIEGNVSIEDGAKILEKAVIKGPCYIGKNVFVGTGAIVRDCVDAEEESVIGAQLEIKNTLLGENTTTHSGFIGDSVIGRNCKIAASITTSNVRLDRNTIAVQLKEQKIDTGCKDLGVLMGDDVKTGIGLSTMPGVIIGRGSKIGPSTTVMENIEENVTYYTKFQAVVKKKNE